MIYATLSGRELLLRSPITWTISYGVSPQTTRIEVLNEDVDQILERSRVQFTDRLRTRTRTGFADTGPVQLAMRDSGYPERDCVMEGLYIAGVDPGDFLNTKTVLLADRRWLASRTLVRRLYNIRKDSGDRRLVGGEGEHEQLGQSVTDYAFRAGTLRGEGEPWTAPEVLADVLEEIFGADGFKIDEVPSFADDVESVELLHYGDEAMTELMSMLPGLEFFVDYDGKVTTANAFSKKDQELANRIRSEEPLYGGEVTLARREPIIPQSYLGMFFARTELRFDYDESALLSSWERLREPLELENVIINPLLRLELADGREANLGEAIPVTDFLAAINLLRDEDGVTRPEITLADLQRKWLDGWTAWSSTYLESLGGSTRRKWATIFGALRSDWRQLFRILSAWADKVYGLSDLLVSILDGENGARAKATVHAQYLRIPSQLATNPKYGGLTNLAIDDYEEDGVQRPRNSPFELTLLSADQGLFRLKPKTDEEGVSRTYVLGVVADEDLPSEDLRDATIALSQVALSPEFKVAVVLSAQRAMPPTEEALHKEEVTLAEAAARLGVEVPKAAGPMQDLRILEDEARFAWQDDEADATREAYYSGADLPARLQINKPATRQLAVAHAARHLAQSMPRYIGSMPHVMRPFRPAGSIQTITHTITPGPGAKAITTATASGNVRAPSVWSMVSPGVRAMLLGRVDRGGAA